MRLALSLFAIALPACSGADSTSAKPVGAPTELVGDASEPLQAFERFLDLNARGEMDSEEGRALLGGEMKLPNNKEPHARMHCDKIVRIDAARAVGRVSVLEPAREVEGFGGNLRVPERTVDVYFFLERSDRWRVTTIRAMANLELLGGLAWSDIDPAEMERLRPGHAETVANARLILSSDRELAQWFRDHQTELDSVASRARDLAGRSDQRSFRNPSLVEVARREAAASPLGDALRALRVSTAELRDDGALEVMLGGITDNTVLFLHVPSDQLPHIGDGDEMDVIWAERVAPGWFLVRTT